MKVEVSTATLNGIGKLSGTLGIGTSILAFFEVNAVGIGALSAFLTFIVYAIFSILNHFRNNKSKENEQRLDKIEVGHKETKEDIKKILDKLG